MQKNDSPAPGRTRSVRVSSLGVHHLGREFVGLGVLEQITIRPDGAYLHCADGLTLLVRDTLQLDYYVTDEDIERKREIGREGYRRMRGGADA